MPLCDTSMGRKNRLLRVVRGERGALHVGGVRGRVSQQLLPLRGRPKTQVSKQNRRVRKKGGLIHAHKLFHTQTRARMGVLVDAGVAGVGRAGP